MINYKKGNVEIIFLTLLVILVIIISSSFYILYFQVNSCIYTVKQDVFYIVQNVYLSLNKDELKLYNYVIDGEQMKEKVTDLLKKNHNNVSVEKIEYNDKINIVKIEVLINIKPLLLSQIIGEIKLKIMDNVKIKMMEVE